MPHESMDSQDNSESTFEKRSQTVQKIGSGRRLGIILVCLVLAAPIIYLAYHHTRESHVSSGTITAHSQDVIATLEEAVRTQPNDANRLNLSLAYINAHQYPNATRILNSLVAENASNAPAWNNLCVIHNELSEFQEALEACGKAVAIAPDFQLAQNNLHWAEAQKQKSLDAIVAAEAMPAASRNVASYLNEGMNYLHVGDFDHALAIWQKLAEREPNNALVANDIGVAYMMKHMRPEATVWFRKAMQLDPSLQLARNNLAWAQSAQ